MRIIALAGLGGEVIEGEVRSDYEEEKCDN